MASEHCTLEDLVISRSFWKNKKVFLTGHTGFKGGWMSLWLSHLGANVTGFSLRPDKNETFYKKAHVSRFITNDIQGNICHFDSLNYALKLSQADIVIHMAAQPLVFESYNDPFTTYNTNILGTVNLLEAVRDSASVKAVLIITSDKCYENIESEKIYAENMSLGGHDPYSSSKACAEIITSAYFKSFLSERGIGVATARSGNVIGGGDWSKNRLVPDAVTAFRQNNPFVVRKPKAIRPWQFVLEPLAGYILLCQNLTKHFQLFSEAWNFGPKSTDEASVQQLAEILVKSWGGDARWVAKEDCKHPHEANSLRLNCTKARTKLGWQPQWNLQNSIDQTIAWYKKSIRGANMSDFSFSQINNFQKKFNKKEKYAL